MSAIPGPEPGSFFCRVSFLLLALYAESLAIFAYSPCDEILFDQPVIVVIKCSFKWLTLVETGETVYFFAFARFE
ncbi:hypothetical protein ACK36A_10545 [Aeromonas veronii]